MPLPLIGKKKFQGNCVVTAKSFLENRKAHNKYPNIQGAKAAVIYFDSSIQAHLEHALPCTQIEFLKSARLYNNRDKGILFYRCPIGAPGSAVILEELVELGIEKVISIGTAGSLQEALSPGDIVLCNRAYRDEGTSYHYLPEGDYFDADPRLKRSLRLALDEHKLSHVAGATWTTDAPYRETAEDVEFFMEKNVLTVEMEISALMAVSRVLQIQYAATLVVSDLLTLKGWSPHFEEIKVGRNLCKLVEAAIDALCS